MGELFLLENQIQNYAWGSREILATMRGVPAPTEQPEAELWVGAHPSAPSFVRVDGESCPLDTLVSEQPERFLPAGWKGDIFPFLFKVLAIDSPLSIQVHPTDEQAEAGFAAEEAQGLALDAPTRCYKDRHSKPETVIALSPMRILTGVRPFAELRAIAEHFKLAWLTGAVNASKTPKDLLSAVLQMPQDAAEAAMQQTVKSVLAWEAKNGKVKGSESLAAGVAELVTTLTQKYPNDRGLLVALVMNLVYLEPGQSAYTPDGQVHAYISGTAIELMNPSDNVLRAGLTSKHVDVDELIKVLGAEQKAPVVEGPQVQDSYLATYSMWCDGLTVTRATVGEGEEIALPVAGVATALCVEGTPVISDDSRTFNLTGTEAVMYVGEPTHLIVSGPGTLYVAAQG
ncbi:mannose-6-phosphate isomerase, class I [Rothia nasimurium]|uniref:mannose-6-phosphate isomerase, class I n=1 Tax=Rothia nasimurium TaxID=85336 RepID=UPI003BA1A459